MANPFTGVILNNRYYGFVEGSYTMSTPFKNSSTETQASKRFSILGLGYESIAITLSLDNTYSVYGFSNNTIASPGPTTWQGVSRRADLINYLNATGASMPIMFTSPDGLTRMVVPTGSLDFTQFIPSAPTDEGVEYRVNLTLEVVPT